MIYVVFWLHLREKIHLYLSDRIYSLRESLNMLSGLTKALWNFAWFSFVCLFLSNCNHDDLRCEISFQMACFCDRWWCGVHRCSQSSWEVNTVPYNLKVECDLGEVNVRCFQTFHLYGTKAFRMRKWVRVTFQNQNMNLFLSLLYLIFLYWEKKEDFSQLLCVLKTWYNNIKDSEILDFFHRNNVGLCRLLSNNKSFWDKSSFIFSSGF